MRIIRVQLNFVDDGLIIEKNFDEEMSKQEIIDELEREKILPARGRRYFIDKYSRGQEEVSALADLEVMDGDILIVRRSRGGGSSGGGGIPSLAQLWPDVIEFFRSQSITIAVVSASIIRTFRLILEYRRGQKIIVRQGDRQIEIHGGMSDRKVGRLLGEIKTHFDEKGEGIDFGDRKIRPPQCKAKSRE